MKPNASRPLWVILFVLTALFALIGISKSLGAGDDLVPWRTDLSKARAEAAGAGRPVLVYFTATWCGPCQGMKRTTWSDARVETALRSYVPVKIDIDQQKELAQRYAVDGIPYFVVLDREGIARRTSVGAMDADEFLAWLKG